MLHDVRDIVDSSPEVDATLRTPPLHIKPTASQVRTQLIEKKELLKDEDLPNRSMISTLLNKLGYRPQKVIGKTIEKTLKGMPFSTKFARSTVKPTRPRGILRLSMDAKVSV